MPAFDGRKIKWSISCKNFEGRRFNTNYVHVIVHLSSTDWRWKVQHWPSTSQFRDLQSTNNHFSLSIQAILWHPFAGYFSMLLWKINNVYKNNVRFFSWVFVLGDAAFSVQRPFNRIDNLTNLSPKTDSENPSILSQYAVYYTTSQAQVMCIVHVAIVSAISERRENKRNEIN